jgi:NADH:ubiquinone reductase (H+-translocating)
MPTWSPGLLYPHRVVIVGGGFAGLNAARALRRARCEITLIDRRNHHLFQPLLYQVATGSLAAAEIAAPLRWVVRRQRNTRVMLAEVTALDLVESRVRARATNGGMIVAEYDTLVVAAGAETSYFGHDEWARHAPGLKSIDDAIRLRTMILSAFEQAEVERDEASQRAWLTFVVIGAGPTGVELAGQIAELARDTMRHDFRRADPGTARVVLVDASPRVLPSFHPALSVKAERAVRALGVEVYLNASVAALDAHGVTVGGERLNARTMIWAAGVRAAPLGRLLADAAGLATDQAGRLNVEPDLTVPGHPDVFGLGDMVTLDSLPGIAPVAIQQGRHAARTIQARLDGRGAAGRFRYRDKGSIATIGRNRAVAEVAGRRFSGYTAWLLWLVVHLTYLIGFQNRLLVLLRWSASWWTRGRGSRLITGPVESADDASAVQ